MGIAFREQSIGFAILGYSFMSRNFILSVSDFFCHQYSVGVCIPQNIHRISIPYLDLCQGVMLLVRIEVPFHTCGTLPPEIGTQYPPQLLILCHTSLAHKRVRYPPFRTVFPICIVSIDGIVNSGSYFPSSQSLLEIDTLFQAYPSIKGIEREILDLSIYAQLTSAHLFLKRRRPNRLQS